MKWRSWLFGVLMVLFAVRTAMEYRTTWSVRHVRTARFESFFKPGLVSCVQWLRSQPGVGVVYGLPYEEDRYLYERMSEMLLPIEYRPLGDAAPARGRLLVMPVSRVFETNAGVVFQDGEYRVWRFDP